LSAYRAAPHGGAEGIGVAHASATHASPVGGPLPVKAGYGRHWYGGNRTNSAIPSVNPCERNAHEQYHLPRRPRRDHPRDLGISRVALARHDAPRTVPPDAHGGSSARLLLLAKGSNTRGSCGASSRKPGMPVCWTRDTDFASSSNNDGDPGCRDLLCRVATATAAPAGRR
jgi:hypothetical protein